MIFQVRFLLKKQKGHVSHFNLIIYVLFSFSNFLEDISSNFKDLRVNMIYIELNECITKY